MATHKMEDYVAHYGASMQDVADILKKIDLDKPNDNVVEKDTPTMRLLQYQAEIQSQAMGKIIDSIRTFLPLKDKAADGEQAAMTVQEQKNLLDKICKCYSKERKTTRRN